MTIETDNTVYTQDRIVCDYREPEDHTALCRLLARKEEEGWEFVHCTSFPFLDGSIGSPTFAEHIVIHKRSK